MIVYKKEVCFRATDDNDEVGIATITVTVGDVNEAPSFAKATSGKRISKDSATGTISFPNIKVYDCDMIHWLC
jgi:hypothetical protein